MNLEEKTLIELKAMIYDFQVTIQQTQKNIEIVNNIIAKKIEEESKSINKPSDDPNS